MSLFKVASWFRWRNTIPLLLRLVTESFCLLPLFHLAQMCYLDEFSKENLPQSPSLFVAQAISERNFYTLWMMHRVPIYTWRGKMGKNRVTSTVAKGENQYGPPNYCLIRNSALERLRMDGIGEVGLGVSTVSLLRRLYAAGSFNFYLSDNFFFLTQPHPPPCSIRRMKLNLMYTLFSFFVL